MNQIASLPAKDRRQLFNEAAVQRGLPPFHVEKDSPSFDDLLKDIDEIERGLTTL